MALEDELVKRAVDPDTQHSVGAMDYLKEYIQNFNNPAIPKTALPKALIDHLNGSVMHNDKVDNDVLLRNIDHPNGVMPDQAEAIPPSVAEGLTYSNSFSPANRRHMIQVFLRSSDIYKGKGF